MDVANIDTQAVLIEVLQQLTSIIENSSDQARVTQLLQSISADNDHFRP